MSDFPGPIDPHFPPGAARDVIRAFYNEYTMTTLDYRPRGLRCQAYDVDSEAHAWCAANGRWIACEYPERPTDGLALTFITDCERCRMVLVANATARPQAIIVLGEGVSERLGLPITVAYGEVLERMRAVGYPEALAVRSA